MSNFLSAVPLQKMPAKSRISSKDPAREPLCSWRAQAQLLYTNWLNYYVYQTTPYDVTRVGA